MSEVTNLIFTFSFAEDQVNRIKEVNFFHNNGRGFELVSADFYFKPNFLSKKRKWYGGTKNLECSLFIGAYNHLDVEGFIEHLRDIEWEYPEEVQIILKKHDANLFEIINVFS